MKELEQQNFIKEQNLIDTKCICAKIENNKPKEQKKKKNKNKKDKKQIK